MKSSKINFTVGFRTEFGNATDKRKCTKGTTAEETFKSALSSLPKRISKTWESIEFEFENEKITVCEHWLEETDFNFSQSHTTEPIEN